MPTIYRQRKGERSPARIERTDYKRVHGLMADIARSYTDRGFTIRGDWNDFIAERHGSQPVSFYVNEVGGSHDEKSGPRVVVGRD
jgi:hypothetical protein